MCNTSSYYGINKETCLKMGYQWTNYWYNYDDAFQGLMTTFVLGNAFRVGFEDVVYYAMDTNTPGAGPILNNNQYISLFYVA